MPGKLEIYVSDHELSNERSIDLPVDDFLVLLVY